MLLNVTENPNGIQESVIRMKQMEFTYRAYAELVQIIRESGYTVTSYQHCDIVDKPCILRHDVDFDIKKAVEFAEFEASMGIRSTYFILCSSKFYNLLDKDSINAVRTIHRLGHDIGLHFDETNYSITKENGFLASVRLELEIMREVVKLPVQSVSMHRPSQETLMHNWNFKDLGGVINSYSEKYFREFKYLSDSRMYWRENPFEAIADGRYPQLHILTHPFWYSESEEDTRSKLLHFVKQASFDRYNSMNDNFRDLQEFVSREELK